MSKPAEATGAAVPDTAFLNANNRSTTSVEDPTPASAEHEPTVKASEVVRNLICGGLGTGMFSLPWAMAGASLFPGVVIVVLVIFVNMWTIMILVEGAEIHQAFDLGALLGKLPGRMGPVMQVFTNIVVWLALMGSLISYIIAIHDSVRPFIPFSVIPDGSRILIVSLAALLILPLCFLPQKYLSWTSVVAFVVNIYLFVLLCDVLGGNLINDDHPAGPAPCFVGFAQGGLTMFSTMAQCIIIQMCVLPMYKELEDRSPKKFAKILLVAFGTLAAFFSLFSLVGYLAYGNGSESNIIKNLPQNTGANIARIGVVGVVSAVYPIMVIPMVAPVENCDLSWFVRRSEMTVNGDDTLATQRRRWAVSATTVLCVVLSWLGGWLVTELGIINVIDGAMCVGVFTSLGPALIGLYCLDRKSVSWQVAMYTLLAVGITTSILGFFFIKNDADKLSDRCLWKS